MSEIRPEVDEDVDNKHDVHYEVHHVERGAGVNTALHDYLFLRGETGETRVKEVREE